jgi:hypothetical protein
MAIALNSAFTRFVNHCITALGAYAILPDQDGRGERGGRLIPTLNVKHEPQLGEKTTLVQHLTAIRRDSPRECLHKGNRFC